MSKFHLDAHCRYADLEAFVRRPLSFVLIALMAFGSLAATPLATVTEPVRQTVSAVTGTLAGEGCDAIDPTLCLLPFPNDRYTVPDETTPTGRRVAFDPLAMPRGQVAGVRPVDPTAWNRNDGFSPGAMVLTFVPELDLDATWAGVTGGDATITAPSASLHPDAPMVIVNADTGERHPFVAELDRHPDTDDDERMLILRPLTNFDEATRYVVGLRDLVDRSGDPIAPSEAFVELRDGSSPRAERFDREVFGVLEDTGVERDELFLAWDFTVASAENLAGRVLHMRDEAFAALGDTDLGNLVVEGDAPAFTVDRVEPSDDEDTAWFVHGTVAVPNYLSLPQETTPELRDPTGVVTSEQLPPLMVPGSRMVYDRLDPAPMDVPQVNPLVPTMDARFICRVPASALPTDGGQVDVARPSLLGHGLLGQRQEVMWSSGDLMTREHNTMYCATEWIGMAFEDLVNVATILLDLSNFPSLADRAQQGFLNFLYLGRALAHPEGFASDPAFQAPDGTPLFDPSELVYDGNSQGGIMGGALTALAPDFTRAVLGVPGMNYSTLLNRSVDWEGAYGEIAYLSYPDAREQQLFFALAQMLWDRGEANGYAHHMTADPYPDTPPHRVLLHAAYGDYQVANLAAEVMARTADAALLRTSLAPGRHWSVEPTFGLETFGTALPGQGKAVGQRRWDGSALVYWDSGNPAPPDANVPPVDVGEDPHGDPRAEPDGGVQKDHFYATGDVIDVRGGAPYWTNDCPRHPEDDPGCGGAP